MILSLSSSFQEAWEKMLCQDKWFISSRCKPILKFQGKVAFSVPSGMTQKGKQAMVEASRQFQGQKSVAGWGTAWCQMASHQHAGWGQQTERGQTSLMRRGRGKCKVLSLGSKVNLCVVLALATHTKISWCVCPTLKPTEIGLAWWQYYKSCVLILLVDHPNFTWTGQGWPPL